MDLTVIRVDRFDADIELIEPFGIATGAQVAAHNVFVRVELACGAEGWGEAAPFPAVNGETRDHARAAVDSTAWIGRDARSWRVLSAEIAPLCGSARCALETALLDALCRACDLPMWAFFGGASTSVETDVTITTGTPAEAALAAARLTAVGVRTLKVKVGGRPLADDLARIGGIIAAAPGCRLLLDANAALSDARTALALLDGVRDRGGNVVLFEQPLRRDDLDGMAELVRDGRCPIAADEAVQSPADVARLALARAADVVNLKTTKSGLIGVMDMAIAARAHGLGLMIGAMVETPLALSASACLAAGMGGFSFVDLDTDRWMRDAPVLGGFVARGPILELSTIAAGHGAVPRLYAKE